MITTRATRQRTRDLSWFTARAHAETVPCPAKPRGCSAPTGTTCRNRHGEELINQPAHLVRSRRADNPPPPPPPPPPTFDLDVEPARLPAVDEVPLPPEPPADDDPYPEGVW